MISGYSASTVLLAILQFCTTQVVPGEMSKTENMQRLKLTDI